MSAALPLRRKRKFGELGLTALTALKSQKTTMGGRLAQDEMKIDNLQRQVRRLKSSSDKKIFQNTSAITMSAAGTITYLSTIAQGAGVGDRLGLDITADQLLSRHDFAFTATGAARVIIFQDKLCAGTLPTVLDVLTSATINSNYNIGNQLNKRHKILADYKVYAVLTNPEVFTNRVKRVTSINKVKYIGTDALIASAGAGSIFILRITNLAASQPTDSFSWELKFKG